jgi:hypothetical protein
MPKPKHEVKMFTYDLPLSKSGLRLMVRDPQGRNLGRVEINYAGIDVFKSSGKKPLHRWYWKEVFAPFHK